MKKQHWTVLSVLAAVAAVGAAGPAWGAQENGAAANATAESQVTYDVSQLDRKPEAKVRTAPKYPAALRAKGVEGEALVECVVKADGKVSGVALVTCTDKGFGEAAIDAVSQWRFRPGEKNGVAVATRLQIPVVFSLKSGS